MYRLAPGGINLRGWMGGGIYRLTRGYVPVKSYRGAKCEEFYICIGQT